MTKNITVMPADFKSVAHFAPRDLDEVGQASYFAIIRYLLKT
jgi:hypothetical protein